MRILNGMFSVLVDPGALGHREVFEAEALAFIDWVQASPPREGFGPVQMAGDAERAAARSAAARACRWMPPPGRRSWMPARKLGVAPASVQAAAGACFQACGTLTRTCPDFTPTL
jgi:uncharacterized oxidoreductase